MSGIHCGECLCGAVRFKAKGSLREVIYCHCTQCRKQSGHYVAATSVNDIDLSIEGEGKLTWYKASADARRGFCSICGSLLFWKYNGLTTTSVMAGAFECPTGLTAESHIFVRHKGDYYQIDDGLPQFDGSSPSIQVAKP